MQSTGAPRPGWPPLVVQALMEELHQRQRSHRTTFRDPHTNQRLVVYAVGGNGNIIRIDNALFSPHQLGLPNGWFVDHPFSSNTQSRRLVPDLPRMHIDPIPGPAPHPPSPSPSQRLSRGWDSATYGWAVGAVMLAVLVLIVRATEKCLDKKLFKRNRRRSDEWPRPNVLATSHQHTDVSIGLDVPLPVDGGQVASNDLPPPYSECANKVVVNVEEPPPPYSACYVAFSNPKDGVPSVHFLNRRRQNMFDRAECSSTRSETNTPIINADIDNSGTNSNSDGRRNTEFVLENRPIIERDTSNDANDVNGPSNIESDIEGTSTRITDVENVHSDVVLNV